MISKRLLFKKVVIMSKGQMPKIRGAFCNVAVDVREICNSLLRNFQSSGIVLANLKKNSIQWSCLFQISLFTKIFRCMHSLEKKKKNYRKTQINIENLPPELWVYSQT